MACLKFNSMLLVPHTIPEGKMLSMFPFSFGRKKQILELPVIYLLICRVGEVFGSWFLFVKTSEGTLVK